MDFFITREQSSWQKKKKQNKTIYIFSAPEHIYGVGHKVSRNILIDIKHLHLNC